MALFLAALTALLSVIWFVSTHPLPTEGMAALPGYAVGLSVGMALILALWAQHKAHRLRQRAGYDALTHLPNRFELEQVLTESPPPLALAIIEVEDYNRLTELYGLEAGDFLIKRLSHYIADYSDSNAKAKLYHGPQDRFVLLYRVMPVHPERLFQSLVEHCEEQSYSFQEFDLPITLNLAWSRDPNPSLLDTAERALRLVKQRRINVLEYKAAQDPQHRVDRNLKLIRLMKKALARDAIVPYYQPILNLQTGQIEGFEALMRIMDERNRLLLPHQFLPVAKESRQYADLTRGMIEKTFQTFRDNNYGLTLNLSMEDILDPDIQDFLFQHLYRFPSVAKRLTLDIPDSDDLENDDAVHWFIQQVQEYGGRLAIDDAGNGLAGLSQVLDLGIDNFKLDVSLIRAMELDAGSRTLVRTIVDLTDYFGIKATTAGHIHNAELLQRATDMGITHAQGFYIGKPAPVPDARPANPLDLGQ